jgi:hypothetical protein
MDEEIQQKVRDFQRNPNYEHRVVAFYDFLGWRSKIAEAGTDPEKIGRLRRMILRHTRSLGGQQQYAAPEVRFSSFSDNVVVSQPVSPSTVSHLLGTLGAFQLVSAADGFFVRGGVTVGWIHHDNTSVFGPALNRAYELESTVANFPRIVADQNVLDALGTLPFFMKTEDGINFVNPFTTTFVGLLASLEKTTTKDVYASLGFPSGGNRRLDSVPSDQLLKFALNGVKPQLRVPLEDKEWSKVAWIHDRIASQLGLPLARSYPRVRPG